jgi:beta-phosphoglucomutase-like phosphatase (HAD superfamily)
MEDFIDKYDLFIFDLDDTIVKTEKYHYSSWLKTIQYFKDTNFYFDYNFFCSKFHSCKEDNIKKYICDELCMIDIKKIQDYKNNFYLNLINSLENELFLIEGFEELINCILNKNKKFVIVTNTNKNNLNYYLNLFSILKYSSKNYSNDMFIHKKPNPECYLNVIKDFPDHKMVGFEDSITGIHALSESKLIDIIFINDNKYYYYNYIIQNYKVSKTINTFLDLKNKSL